MSEWIEWRGGVCPLPNGTKHQVMLRNGEEYDDDHPESWFWGHYGGSLEIIAYRLVPANDNTQQDHATAINALAAHLHSKSASAGWWNDIDPSDPYVAATKLMLIVSEISEAMEGIRKDLIDDKLPHRKMGEVELADALIRICDLASALGYDLGGAVVEKVAYNDNRADHKLEARAAAGGKRF